MKKILIFLMFFYTSGLSAQTLNGMSEAEKLGSMAGIALACNAGQKLDDFELISSYILSNQSVDDAQRNKALRQYAEAKLRAYNIQRDTEKSPCSEVLNHFYNQSIFDVTIYSDGSVKFPDGKILKPFSKLSKSQQNKKKQEIEKNYMIPPRR